MNLSSLCVTLILLATLLTVCLGNNSHIAESTGPIYAKHSFRAPFLFGTNANIPHWEYGGSAVATENFVRLVPAIRSRVGWMWNTEPVDSSSWEVIIELNVHNTHSPGADGMAFWYAKDPKKTGSLYGHAEDFDGIGIVIDTYDNNGNGDNPSIIAIQNHGQTQSWDYDHDLQANQLDRCKADLRNPVNGNTKLRIIYNNEVLQVLVDAHGSGNFAFCFAIEKLKLPRDYYFGLTAMTGGLADYHDVYAFQMRDLEKKSEKQSPSSPTEQQEGRRRGWYDPYSEQPQQQDQPQQYQPQQQMPPREQAKTETDDNTFFESLRQKLRKFGFEDNQQEQKQSNENDAQTQDIASENEDEHKKAFRKRIRAMQNQRKPETNAPSHSQQQESPQQGEGLTQTTGLLILEALEQVEKTVRASSTKNELSSILNRVQDVSEKQQSVQSSMEDVKNNLKTEISSLTNNLKIETKHLSDEIKRLDTMLNTLYVQMDHVQSTQGKMEKEMERTTHDVKQTIKKESSFGFWTFFIMFQIVFTAGIIYWRKYRDVKAEKLF